MVIFYLFLVLIIGNIIYSVVKAVRTKRYGDLISMLLMLPFLVFAFSSMQLGGSAFNDALHNYPQYQQGNYYLMSHGNYKEVSYGIYLYMKIIQIFGIASFALGFIYGIIRNIRQRRQAN